MPRATCWTAEGDEALVNCVATYGVNWRFACDQVREATGRQITPSACFRRWSLLEQQRATTGAAVLPRGPHLPFQRWARLNEVWRRWVESQERLNLDPTPGIPSRMTLLAMQQQKDSKLTEPHVSHAMIVEQALSNLGPGADRLRSPMEISRATYQRIDTMPQRVPNQRPGAPMATGTAIASAPPPPASPPTTAGPILPVGRGAAASNRALIYQQTRAAAGVTQPVFPTQQPPVGSSQQ
jgi:hypothetical protein